jgi:hypothetical protein
LAILGKGDQMKRILILSVLSLIVLIMNAQEINLWQGFRHSAVTPSNRIHLKWEGVSNPFDSLKVIYKHNNLLNTLPVSPLNVLNYECSIPVPDYDAPSVAFSSLSDYYGVLTPLKINSNNFIPSVMVKASNDSLNEAVLAGDTKLDIISYHFAYSNDQFAAGIKNSIGNYPAYGSLVGPYYIYGVGFLNPENIMDSTAYAMINANLIGIITPGLYKIRVSNLEELQNIDLSAIQRVGDISSATTENMLIMKCNWSTLTNDEDFGNWPSYSKSLLTIPFIMKIPSISNMTPVGDTGAPTVINFCDLSLNLAQNTLPVMSNPIVSEAGDMTLVRVTYNDQQGNFPLIAKFTVEDVDYTMMPETFDFQNPVIFSTIVPNQSWVIGECAFSDDSLNVVNYTISNTVSADHMIETGISVRIYPNPVTSAKRSLNFEVKGTDPIRKVSLYNIKGQKIVEYPPIQKTNKMNISLENHNGDQLASGVYFVKVDLLKKTEIRKILVID